MTIHYKNNNDFYLGINWLVKQGLTFKADHETLTIHLTGGY